MEESKNKNTEAMVNSPNQVAGGLRGGGAGGETTKGKIDLPDLLELMDDLAVHGALLLAIEDDVNSGAKWLQPLLPGIVSAAGRKLLAARDYLQETT